MTNALLIDSERRMQKFANLVWSGERFELGDLSGRGDDGRGLAWSPFLTSRGHLRGGAELRESFRSEVEDAGASFRQHDQSLRLEEVFVPPDLLEMSAASNARLIDGRNTLAFLVGAQSQGQIVISGDDQSGKTSLAKMVFLAALEAGRLPVLVGGEGLLPVGDQLYEYLDRRFESQYREPDLEAYRQDRKEKRVIIVDDFHLLTMPPRKRQAFVEGVAKYAGKVILFAHDLSIAIDEIHSWASTLAFVHYRIQPFGYRRRQQLAEKWLLKSDPQAAEPARLATRLAEVERVIDIVVGKNFVPAYPIYLLAILQASEAAVPVDISAGTHGYYYELLIRSTLAEGREGKDFDILLTALSWLAGEILASGDQRLSRQRVIEVLGEYERCFDVTLDVGQLLGTLVRRRVLREEGDVVYFRYPFLYFYFAALYLRDRLDSPEVLDRIRGMAVTLYEPENANVFLFLAHLSRHSVLVEVLLEAAARACGGVQEAELRGDVAFLGEDAGRQIDVVYEETDPVEYRRSLAEKRDDVERGEANQRTDSAEDEDGELVAMTRDLEASLKTLQILGQVLKNFPGSMPRDEKLAIARACYGLGRRLLSWILELLGENKEYIARELIRKMRGDHPELELDEIASRADAVIFWLARVVSYGVVRRISSAVGSKDLSRTYERLLADEPEIPAVRLIDVSIALDSMGRVPVQRIETMSRDLRDEGFALGILQMLVVQHLYLFPVPYNVKQKLCAALDIEYREVKERALRPRLLKA